MPTEIVEIDIEPEDKAELDRLVEIYGGGDPSEFLREAMRFMAALERGAQVPGILDPKL